MDNKLDIVYEKNRKRAIRRKKNMSKALRKQKISKSVIGFERYDNLNQYHKNKIHCSCNLCRSKPTYDPNAITSRQDERLIDSCNQKLKEFNNNDYDTIQIN